jgi:hypothetical protein
MSQTIKSKLIFKLLSIHKLRLHPPYRVVIRNPWELLCGVAHNLLGNQFLNLTFNWEIFTLRSSEVTTHRLNIHIDFTFLYPVDLFSPEP